ncbi:hemerythrin domain-containing protein [Nocardia rhizosphaerihabitans]
MDFLHHHHESEDERLYPIVRARNLAARPLLDRMDADHRSILPAMTALTSAAAAYNRRNALHGDLSRLARLAEAA